MNELYNQIYQELKHSSELFEEITDDELKSYYEGRVDALTLALNLISIYVED